MTHGSGSLGRRTFLLGLASAALPWRRSLATPTTRVIVIGSGFGGATCAKYLRALAPDSQVLLVDQRKDFLTGPFSNLVIAGLRSAGSIMRTCSAIGASHGVQTRQMEVTQIDPVAMSIRNAAGEVLRADRIVLAPGISMRWGPIAGLDAANSGQMPHAWLGDSQVGLLRSRLRAVSNGATVVIGAPPNPYRCPPGPYERASLFAYELVRTGRTRTKIVIADAKDDFSKSALFKLEWDRLYPGMIEWIPRQHGGEIARVDEAKRSVWLHGSTKPIHAELASIIPAQQAAALAARADLVDESGWCPVKAENFESTRHAGIHVIGDACAAAPMPKSAFSANSQAKLCASAIAASLQGGAPPLARLLNTCYSLVSDHAAISVSGYYGAIAGKLSALSEGMSPLAGDDRLRSLEAREAYAWYASITRDSFGTR